MTISRWCAVPDGLDGGFDRRVGPQLVLDACSAQEVADLTDVAGEDEGDPVPLEVVCELDEHARRGHVDVRHALRVEYDRPGAFSRGLTADAVANRLGIGEEEPALRPEHDDAGDRFVLGMPRDVPELRRRAGHPAEDCDVGPGGSVDQEHERGADSDEECSAS